MLEDHGHHTLAAQLTHSARLVRYEAPELVLSSSRPLPADLPRDLADALKRVTERVWRITLSDEPGAPSLREAAKAAEEAARQAILATPLVRAALEAFPGAELEWSPERSIA